jgi:hypothetical protein
MTAPRRSRQGTPVKPGVREGGHLIDRHRDYADPGGAGKTDPKRNPDGSVGQPAKPKGK